MESREETTARRRDDERPDTGASILLGVFFGLAAYGLYKLVKQESEPRQALPERVDSDLIRRIMESERPA